jgi:catechol 2,3-dioxygenase-like lactoylglutathione lyase family enzyme
MGIHHIKFAVTDLDRSPRFYEGFLGAKRIAEADHRRVRLYTLERHGPELMPDDADEWLKNLRCCLVV